MQTWPSSGAASRSVEDRARKHVPIGKRVRVTNRESHSHGFADAGGAVTRRSAMSPGSTVDAHASEVDKPRRRGLSPYVSGVSGTEAAIAEAVSAIASSDPASPRQPRASGDVGRGGSAVSVAASSRRLVTPSLAYAR